MNINPIFPLVAGICVLAFLSSIVGKKNASLLILTVLVFVWIISEAI